MKRSSLHRRRRPVRANQSRPDDVEGSQATLGGVAALSSGSVHTTTDPLLLLRLTGRRGRRAAAPLRLPPYSSHARHARRVLPPATPAPFPAGSAAAPFAATLAAILAILAISPSRHPRHPRH